MAPFYKLSVANHESQAATVLQGFTVTSHHGLQSRREAAGGRRQREAAGGGRRQREAAGRRGRRRHEAAGFKGYPTRVGIKLEHPFPPFKVALWLPDNMSVLHHIPVSIHYYS